MAEIKQELVTEPPLPEGTAIDIGAVLAKRRERAVGEDAERAKVMAQPILSDGTRDMSGLTVEEKLALLGLTAEELRAVLKGEG